MTFIFFPRLLLAAVAVAAVLPSNAQVQVYQGTLSLPAYKEGLPNPNPPFDEYATTRFDYPYTLRDNLTSHRAIETFRAVYLENKYLKCTILPDLGGHIYTCVDKINNVPMFYENPSIKEAQIGMRGGWAAFGEEFNFPVSHSWTTISPVDFSFTTEKDGSGSVTVSNVDRVYGMQWTVQIVLRPGTTLLEQHITLNNRSDVRHRFYWWSNAGIQVWDDSRICYPMRYTAAHGFANIEPWPVDSSGIDLSVLKNQTFGFVSRFIYGSREPYMGIWNPKTNAGVAHYANYAELPAKKIWSWGADADALDWRRALSDNDSAYMEVQSGLFRNQETYAFLGPRQTLRFSEYWMPLHDLGGLARANLAGAANLSRSGMNLVAALNVNRDYPHAEVRILDGTTLVKSDKVNLTPAITWKQEVPLADQSHHYTLQVSDSAGHILLTQTEGKYDWTPDAEIHVGPQPDEVVPAPAKRSADDWLQIGRNQELNGELLIAAHTYADALRAFPGSHSLQIASGRLDVALLHYKDAVQLLAAAQAEDTPNSEIAYYLALAYDGLGDTRDARTNYETAARLPPLRAAARLRLAELDARAGELLKADDWLTLVLNDVPDDLRTAEELAAVKVAEGQTAAARELAADWLAHFPTSYFLDEVIGKPEIEHLAADPARVLNIAAEYMRLGFYQPALTVLSRQYPKVPAGESEPGSVLPQNDPIVSYYAAYCLRKLGRPSAAEQTTASHQSLRYIFPSGSQSAQVLTSATENDPADATAQDLLGMLEFSVGKTAEAAARWDRAITINPKLNGLNANRGFAALVLDHNPEKALTAFRQEAANDPANQAIYMGEDQALSLLQRPPSEFVQAMSHFPNQEDIQPRLVYELALHEAESGDFNAAQALFRNRYFAREESGTNVRAVWIEVELERLQAAARASHCDEVRRGLQELNQPQPGMSFTTDGLGPLLAVSRVQYEIAEIDLSCHQKAAANAALQKASAGTADEDIPWAYEAAKLLPGFDAEVWRERLLSALNNAEAAASTHPLAMYDVGMLEQELGQAENAQVSFRKVFLLPDELLAYHLARLAEQNRAE